MAYRKASDPLGACRPPPARSPPSGRGSLFKSGHRRLALGVMARAGREFAIVHGPQLAAQGLLGEGDAELLPDPCDQVDQTPAHHAVNRGDRARIDPSGESSPVGVGELGRLAGWLAVDQALGSMGVELHHPVAHDLDRDPANPGRLGAACPLIDRGQRQQAPRLRAILGLTSDRAQCGGVEVCPERNRHGEPPSFATLNQTRLKPARPKRVTPSGTWYYTWRPRLVKNSKRNSLFVSFTPAVSAQACTTMRRTTRRWNPRNRTDLDLPAIATLYNPILRGWVLYYGRFSRSALAPVLRHFDQTLVAWAMRKYKRLKGHKTRACCFIEHIRKRNPGLFAHWTARMPTGCLVGAV